MTIIDAIYEHGVFRPVRQVTLTEGTRVEIVLPQAVSPPSGRAAAAKLASLAAMAPPRSQPESTSSQHDRVLYDPAQHQP